MIIKTLSPAEQVSYDTFIAGHESGSFLQSWAWGNWQHTGSKRVSRYFVYGDNGEVSLAAQVIVMSVPKLRRSYLYIPYGPLLKTGFTASESQLVIDFFLSELQNLFPEALFIRVEPK